MPASFSASFLVFSLADESCKVRELGLKYTLDGASLDNEFPLGVSNEMADECAEIALQKGKLLIYIETDTTDFIENNRTDDIHQKLNLYF